MKARGGQIAVFLVFVLVALCLLVVVNVNAFLAVRCKFRAMNAADAAVLTVAACQAECLNEIGRLNCERLVRAIENNDPRECNDLALEQMRTCFLGPLRAIDRANRAARENGGAVFSDAKRIYDDHVNDIRVDYLSNPDLYPPPYDRYNDCPAEGCGWEDFARELSLAMNSDLYAIPANAEFADELNVPPLMSKYFYEAASGMNWCWFRSYGLEWTLSLDSRSLPDPVKEHVGIHWNCELYPLHLTFRTWKEAGLGAFDREWTNLICRLTGKTELEIAASRSTVLTNDLMVWAFYDATWREWGEVSVNPNRYNHHQPFPVVGEIRPEFNVKGCLAQCRVYQAYTDLLSGNADMTRSVSYVPMAKPFGALENLDGEVSTVTCLHRLVVPVDWTPKLVPVASSGYDATHDSSDPAWMDHVRHIRMGAREKTCHYCQILDKWDDDSYRKVGRDWLQRRSSECAVEGGEDGEWGGNGFAY